VVLAVSGTANTGGGGGGEGNGGNAGGNGGSGVVIIRYTTGTLSATCGGTETTVGGDTVCTFTSSGTFTVAGTAAAASAPWLFENY
jgi:hypothetical protein